MRNSARLLPLLLILPLAGCFGDWGEYSAFHEDFHFTRPLTAGGTVSVEGFNGSVEVIGWEQDSVEISGTKYASSRPALESLHIDITPSPGSVRIRASKPSDSFWRAGVRFSIRVPRKTLLDRVVTSNGKIQVESLDGNAHLQTSNGAIHVSQMKGELQASTSNGSIEARDINGNVNVRSSNGAIRAEATHGSFEGVTSNSSITVRLNDPARNGPVRLQSSNGRVDLTLDGQDLPEVRAGTSNGSIELRLPASVNARVRATTTHSSVSSEFDELHSGEDDDRRRRTYSELSGTLGHGGPLIELTTRNGAIHIAKR